MLTCVYKYLLLLIIIAIGTSCVDSDKQQARNLVKEWSGKEI